MYWSFLEILLSVIEIFGNGFEAGDLGPSTIVGSAAFNLFVIIGICIAVSVASSNKINKCLHSGGSIERDPPSGPHRRLLGHRRLGHLRLRLAVPYSLCDLTQCRRRKD